MAGASLPAQECLIRPVLRVPLGRPPTREHCASREDCRRRANDCSVLAQNTQMVREGRAEVSTCDPSPIQMTRGPSVYGVRGNVADGRLRCSLSLQLSPATANAADYCEVPRTKGGYMVTRGIDGYACQLFHSEASDRLALAQDTATPIDSDLFHIPCDHCLLAEYARMGPDRGPALRRMTRGFGSSLVRAPLLESDMPPPRFDRLGASFRARGAPKRKGKRNGWSRLPR
jgi:hypothetical protein